MKMTFEEALEDANSHPSPRVPQDECPVQKYYHNKSAVEYYKFLTYMATDKTTGADLWFSESADRFISMTEVNEEQLEGIHARVASLSPQDVHLSIHRGILDEYGVFGRVSMDSDT